MKYFTYILFSKKDGRRYIGSTSDVVERLEAHNAGLNPTTQNRWPLRLLCFRELDTKIEAIHYERYLKSLKGGKQLEIEIAGMLQNAVVAQLVEQLHGKE